MATFITIVDTIKQGWFTVKTNGLYASGAVTTKELNIEKKSVNAINIIKETSGTVYVEVHISNTAPPFTLSPDLTQSRFYPIESVNGEAIADADDLKDKILNLI